MAQIIEENDEQIKVLLKEYFNFLRDKELNKIDEERSRRKSMKFKKFKIEKEAMDKEKLPKDHVNMVI